MKRWPVVCVFAWAVAAAVAADASVSELAPPDTKVAIGINVRGLLDSPLASEIGGADREAITKMAATGNFAGFDPFKDVDQAWVLMTGASDKAPALVVVRGRFDLERLGSGAARYKDVPVLEGKGGGAEGAIGLLSGQTVIFGETAQVHAAIDRLGSDHLDAELRERIAAAASRYEIWAMGEIPEQPPAAPAAGAQGPGLGSIDRFMIGVSLRQGAGLTAEIHARTTEDAAKLTASIAMIEAAMKAQIQAGGGTFDVQSENGTFRIAMTVSEEQVRQAIAEQRAAMMKGLSEHIPGGIAVSKGEPAAAAAPAPAPAPTPAPAVMVSPLPARVAAPPAPPKPKTSIEIVNKPDGDTYILKLPGAK